MCAFSPTQPRNGNCCSLFRPPPFHRIDAHTLTHGGMKEEGSLLLLLLLLLLFRYISSSCSSGGRDSKDTHTVYIYSSTCPQGAYSTELFLQSLASFFYAECGLNDTIDKWRYLLGFFSLHIAKNIFSPNTAFTSTYRNNILFSYNLVQ